MIVECYSAFETFGKLKSHWLKQKVIITVGQISKHTSVHVLQQPGDHRFAH